MDNLPIVVVVVLVVAVLAYLLFFRKKPELPAPSAQKEAGAAPSPKPAQIEPSAAKERVPSVKAEVAPPVPPADESVPAVVTPAAQPPVVSKKDVAGLRKGLAATRG